MSNQVFIADFIEAQVDATCSMKYWHARLEGGRGMVRPADVVPALIDTAVHADLRTISEMDILSPELIQAAINDILSALAPEDRDCTSKMELLYRRLGWLAAFALYVEPGIRKTYDTIPYDGEMILNRDPLFVITHPDRLLMHKETKEVTYREYVSMVTGLTHKAWLQSWHYNMRLHAGMAAAQQVLEQKVHYGEVMGLNRGYLSLVDGKMRHPYVYGYRNTKRNEWSTALGRPNDDWDLFPIWEFPGGVVQWVQMCGPHVAESQFPVSPAVALKQDLLEAWCTHRLHREREIKLHHSTCLLNKHLRKVYFPINTTQCLPAVGEKCEYLEACWDQVVGARPFMSGKFVAYRDPAQEPVEMVGEVVM